MSTDVQVAVETSAFDDRETSVTSAAVSRSEDAGEGSSSSSLTPVKDVDSRGSSEDGGVEGVDDDFLYLDVDQYSEKDGDVGGLGQKAIAAAVGEKVAAAKAAAGVAVEAPADGQGLVPSASKDLLARLVRSLSTPMMDGLDDWAGVEDPDWKANHQLSWEQLTGVREIGKGLSCTVYTARVPGRKAKVIAKVARPRSTGRLEDQAERQLEAEFNVLRQVSHPHIVELLGAGFTPEERRFLLFEYLPEGTLGEFHALNARETMHGTSTYQTLKRGFRRLTKDLRHTLGNVLQVAEGLEYLHCSAIPGAVVVHRDIRPDNVGLARGEVVKIFDFGLAKALMKGHKTVGEVGSLRFAAPEVSMGLPHDASADVYSWALLAWSVVSGHAPYEGMGRSVFYSRVVIGGERPAMEQSWPKGFQDLLKDCWSGDPTLRPEMTEVVTRVKAILHVTHH